MAPVRVSLRIPGPAPMLDLVKLIQDVKATGFDGAKVSCYEALVLNG